MGLPPDILRGKGWSSGLLGPPIHLATSYPPCHHLPEVRIPAGVSLTCLGISQCHLRQPLPTLLGPESPIFTQKPCRSDSWVLGSNLGPGLSPPWGALGSGSSGGRRELTAVTMGGVGAQADITGHQEAGEGLAQQTDCPDSWGVVGISCRAPLILVAEEGQSNVPVT